MPVIRWPSDTPAAGSPGRGPAANGCMRFMTFFIPVTRGLSLQIPPKHRQLPLGKRQYSRRNLRLSSIAGEYADSIWERVCDQTGPGKAVEGLTCKARPMPKLQARLVLRRRDILRYHSVRTEFPCPADQPLGHRLLHFPAHNTTAKQEVHYRCGATLYLKARQTDQPGVAESVADPKCPDVMPRLARPLFEFHLRQPPCRHGQLVRFV